MVACAGVGYACHAEVVAVPVNLCVKLPDNADMKAAAYNTLGAIAMLPKEYVEVYSSGVTAVLDDFRELKVYGGRKVFRKKLLSQDKGQKRTNRRGPAGSYQSYEPKIRCHEQLFFT